MPTEQTPGADPAGKSLGMGGEAVEHFPAHQPGGDGPGDGPGDGDRAGSEPLPREREHVPSYGGMGGRPRVSSDQREPADPEGDANVARGEGGPPPTPAHGAPGGQADASDPPYPTPS